MLDLTPADHPIIFVAGNYLAVPLCIVEGKHPVDLTELLFTAHIKTPTKNIPFTITLADQIVRPGCMVLTMKGEDSVLLKGNYEWSLTRLDGLAPRTLILSTVNVIANV